MSDKQETVIAQVKAIEQFFQGTRSEYTLYKLHLQQSSARRFLGIIEAAKPGPSTLDIDKTYQLVIRDSARFKKEIIQASPVSPKF